MNFPGQRHQGSKFFESVNEEFIETAMMVFPTNEKLSGHCLGNILCGALSRRFRSVSVLLAEPGCPAIIDTGASKTVISQGNQRAASQFAVRGSEESAFENIRNSVQVWEQHSSA